LIASCASFLLITKSENKPTLNTSETKNSSENLLNGGWYEVKNNIPILHLNGSYYRMGYQQGFLIKEKILQYYRALLAYFKSNNFPYGQLLDIWNSTFRNIPKCYIDEMHGIADGANISFEYVAVENIMCLVLYYLWSAPAGCTGIAAWGPATRDGRLYHMRSNDMDRIMRDPETGAGIWDTAVLFVRTPTDAYSSVSPDFPGLACTWNGINEHKISIGETYCRTEDITFDGIGEAFRIRMALDSADSAEDAIDILGSNRAEGCNIIVSDGNIPTAYIIEQTANHLYIGSWGSKTESNRPCWKINHVIRRGNFFENSELIKTQPYKFTPRLWTFRFLLKNMFGFKNVDDTWNLAWKWLVYKALSKGIMKNWGELDLTTIMQLTRNTYDYNYNIFWKYYGKKTDWYSSESGLIPCWQWVACPENGNFLLSMAHKETSAHKMPTVLFNIYDLIDAMPP